MRLLAYRFAGGALAAVITAIVTNPDHFWLEKASGLLLLLAAVAACHKSRCQEWLEEMAAYHPRSSPVANQRAIDARRPRRLLDS